MRLPARVGAPFQQFSFRVTAKIGGKYSEECGRKFRSGRRSESHFYTDNLQTRGQYVVSKPKLGISEISSFPGSSFPKESLFELIFPKIELVSKLSSAALNVVQIFVPAANVNNEENGLSYELVLKTFMRNYLPSFPMQKVFTRC